MPYQSTSCRQTALCFGILYPEQSGHSENSLLTVALMSVHSSWRGIPGSLTHHGYLVEYVPKMHLGTVNMWELSAVNSCIPQVSRPGTRESNSLKVEDAYINRTATILYLICTSRYEANLAGSSHLFLDAAHPDNQNEDLRCCCGLYGLGSPRSDPPAIAN